MATLKQLRLRVASVKSIQRITKTMQMVAGAKLRGFQTRMMQVCVLFSFTPKSRIKMIWSKSEAFEPPPLSVAT